MSSFTDAISYEITLLIQLLFQKKNIIFLRKLYRSYIVFIFNNIVHINFSISISLKIKSFCLDFNRTISFSVFIKKSAPQKSEAPF